MRSWTRMTSVWEAAYATLRGLTRDRSFTVLAVGTFGLGVAAAGTVFSAFDAVVLRPLPYDDPARLVSVGAESVDRGWHREYVAPANLFDWREAVSGFSDVAAYYDQPWDRIATDGNRAEVVPAGAVSGNLFRVLGVRPVLGRDFRLEETWSDAPPTVILGHDFWVRWYGSDPDVIGRSLRLNDVAHEVIGVMPVGFRYLAQGMDVWIPFGWSPAQRESSFFRRAHLVRAVARLAPGATPKSAETELKAVAASLASDHPATNQGLTAGITPLGDYLVGDRATTLWAGLVAVGILLVGSCATVVQLVLARWNRRRADLAIRRTLGAAVGDLVRDAVWDAAWISLGGLVVGFGGAFLGMRLMEALAPADLLRSEHLTISGRFLAAAVAALVGAIGMFGVAPLRRSTRMSPAGLSTTRGGGGGGVDRARAGRALVVVQVALAAVLISDASLLARSFVAIRGVDSGFDADGVLTFAVPFPDGSDEAAGARLVTAERMAEDLRDLPRVTSVGLVRMLPIVGNGWTSPFSVEGRGGGGGGFEVVHRGADAGYFATMRVPVVRGRLFVKDDRDDALVVNEAFARRAFTDENPVGRRVAFTDDPSASTRWWTILGVVGDERQNGLASAVRPEIFTALAFDTPRTFRFVVRTTAAPVTLVPAVRRLVREIDPTLAVDQVSTLSQVVSRSMGRERFLLLLTGVFAAFAAALGVSGVYAVSMQQAAEWRGEMAVRMAVGAAPTDILTMVLGRTGRLLALGLVLGGGIYGACIPRLRTLLFHVSPVDPATLGAVALSVAAAAWVATLPAAVQTVRRARDDVEGLSSETGGGAPPPPARFEGGDGQRGSAVYAAPCTGPLCEFQGPSACEKLIGRE